MATRTIVLAFVLFYLQSVALAQPVEPPGAVTVYSGIPGEVMVRWSHPGADSFRVAYSASLDGAYVTLAVVTSPPYVDNEVHARRFYAVTAYLGGVESVPAIDRAGYFRMIAAGLPGFLVFTPFGLPLRFWDVAADIPSYGFESTSPSDICGSQPQCGVILVADRILRQDNGYYAYRSSAYGCAWRGVLEIEAAMIPGCAYWYFNRTGESRPLVLAGETDTCGNYLNLRVTADAYTSYSWRDARNLNRNTLFPDSGFGCGTSSTTSDRVVAESGGASFWHRCSDNTWQGTLFSVEPGQAYWIQNRGEEWYYNYAPCDSAAPAMIRDPQATAVEK